MSGFTFEKNLPHQNAAVNSLMNIFQGARSEITTSPRERLFSNPELHISKSQYLENIKQVQLENGIELTDDFSDGSRIIDISMETGTGKTYTYTKTIYDLNKTFNLNKFIVVVPTLSIKAGTVSFLKSDALKEHFKDDYQREVKTYVVESIRAGVKKSKKSFMPQSIHDFVNADSINSRYIHVLVINSGMINSETVQEFRYDVGLFDNQHDRAIDALKAVKPLVIIDEPHKFPTRNNAKTWSNIEKLSPQYIIRYGATFNDDYKNLVYRLTAVDAFNGDLVKGVNAYVESLVGNDTANLKLKKVESGQAFFELDESGKKTLHAISRADSLTSIHSAIHDLFISNMRTGYVLLSNGVELKVGESINPFSYSHTLQDNMMQRAIKEHFKLEKHLMTKRPRIKPLTLFFIDDIEGYREGGKLSGSLKQKFESWVKAEAKRILENEVDPFYRSYLEETIRNVSKTHGGYFSKDNTEKDEQIESEITEILHDKELLLSLNNTRRFIFSKWTLREGWDNPNVFQICKLRSSGSTTSKLQEVGRGLRLPVNEYMARVKDTSFSLNYFVDFTEKDFVRTLIDEINSSSFRDVAPSKLTNELEEKILGKYPDKSAFNLMSQLIAAGVMDENKNFLESGAVDYLKREFPKAFPVGVKPNKVQNASQTKTKTKMRVGKYEDLRQLWELINQKAVLEYRIPSEDEFLKIFIGYLKAESHKFKKTGVQTEIDALFIHNDIAMSKSVISEEDDFTKFNTFSYMEFLSRLSQETFIKLHTLHIAFVKVKELFDVREYLNIQTIRKIKSGFSNYMLNNAFGKFQLSYDVVTNTIHPTKFTDGSSAPLTEVNASDLGTKYDSSLKTLDSYLFEEVFYDSELEKQNIVDGEIESVTVFTKIPKNSIRIPVAGGYTYSPDFAYVVQTSKGEILNFVIETKNVDGEDKLRQQEESKINHAKAFFNKLSKTTKVEFKTQFQDDDIIKIIKQHL